MQLTVKNIELITYLTIRQYIIEDTRREVDGINKLSENEFNKLMRNAIKKRRMHPDVSIDAITTISCLSYQGRDDYGDIRKQVAYNLEKTMIGDYSK